ncbi:hypothetical protein HELRODRAFT_153467, partial [Helobdella robusta]|uniref:Endonuclease/exonuclease/phosphatase domain-containing protein n=1 Tax=Helobdella robusta TaxID=6412 RepID=T1EL77_HELRO
IATIAHLLSIPNIILMGDLNAHYSLWYSNIENQRGEALADEIDISDCGTLNQDTPTRLPNNGQPTSP